jgi:hypothetical protein
MFDLFINTTVRETILALQRSSNILLAQHSRWTTIPYLMIQPKMANQMVMYSPKRRGHAFAKDNKSGLFNFASQARLTLRNAIPYAITDALIRVDIFQSKKGLVVNEFESLEATFYSVKDEEATIATN